MGLGVCSFQQAGAGVEKRPSSRTSAGRTAARHPARCRPAGVPWAHALLPGQHPTHHPRGGAPVGQVRAVGAGGSAAPAGVHGLSLPRIAGWESEPAKWPLSAWWRVVQGAAVAGKARRHWRAGPGNDADPARPHASPPRPPASQGHPRRPRVRGWAKTWCQRRAPPRGDPATQRPVGKAVPRVAHSAGVGSRHATVPVAAHARQRIRTCCAVWRPGHRASLQFGRRQGARWRGRLAAAAHAGLARHLVGASAAHVWGSAGRRKVCGFKMKIVHADGHGCVAGSMHVLKGVGGGEERWLCAEPRAVADESHDASRRKNGAKSGLHQKGSNRGSETG